MKTPEATQEFWHRLRAQDEEAFATLVAQHEAVIQGFCYSLGLRGADIEEVTTVVFANVYRALPQFDGRAQIGTWLYRIAYRTILAERKRIRKFWSTAELDDQLPAAGGRPEQHLEETELQTAIWNTVAQLPARQALAIEMHYRRDCSVAEIAAVLQCPEGTVKTLLFRARRELRSLLRARGIV